MFQYANVLQPLIDLFDSVLKFFHDHVGLSWGAAIIALTCVVRAALLPLTVKQYHSMQRMARLQPDIKRLQAKYKGDRQRLQQEMMKFYRENKVNPLASCLPLLAQFPVMLSLYFMLKDDLRYSICPIRNPPERPNPAACGHTPESEFLFIPDLTSSATGGVLIALLVLYVASQLGSSLLATTSTDRNQRLLIMALPLVFVAFIWQFPAGLILYWIATNIWTIGQQLVIKRMLKQKTPEEGEVPAGAVASVSGGGKALEKQPGEAPASRRLRRGGGEGEKGEGPAEPKPKPSGPPPRSPRKKKKRSGRRR